MREIASISLIFTFFLIGSISIDNKEVPTHAEISSTSYIDSLDYYVDNIKERSKEIIKSRKVISLNNGYEKNIINKKKKEEIKTGIKVQEVSRIIAYKLEFTDSICIDPRGFIGRKIFNKSDCKEWKKRTYKIIGDTVFLVK